MSRTSGFLLAILATTASITIATAQKPKAEPEQLSARDMFYHPVKMAATPAPPPKSSTPPKGKSGTKSTPVEVATARNDSTPTPVSQPPRSPDGTPVTNAAVRKTAPPPTEGPALGLRYTLVKKGNGEGEVATDTVFHTGDQIQLKIETNIPAYLYIISRGSSGTWKVQVPAAESANGSNHVEAMRPYYFPSADQAFTFHDPKGAEKLFVIVSREPLADIQDQIYGLQGNKPNPASQPDPLPSRKSAVIEARANIPENQIDRFRTLYSRDLIIEKVNPETTGDRVEKKEYAMYVVNPTGSKTSRLVADISLEHQ